MTSIPLALVVDFLRRHDALSVLEGAPYIVHDRDGIARLCGVWLPDLDHFEDDALLYLGSGEICPAAEGWAARVLALAVADTATHIDFSSLSAAELMRGNRLLARWIWHDYQPRTATFRERPIIGAPPSTPAERLAAVLRFELERVR